MGPLSALKDSAGSSKLLGTGGLAHSRTNGGGSARRAQPFVGFAGLSVGMGTGVHGIFGAEKKEARQSIAMELYNSGVTFPSAEAGISGSAELPDGTTIHNSDLVVQAVEHQLQLGHSPKEAICKVVTQLPAEGAYVFLFRDFPNELYLANYNLRLIAVPMHNSAIVVSSLLALSAEERSCAIEVEMNSIIVCKAGKLEVNILDSERDGILNRFIPPDIDVAFLNYVRSHPNTTWSAIAEKALLPLFPAKQATLLMPLGFTVAERLILSGKVSLHERPVEALLPSSCAVEAVFRVIE